MPITPRHDAIVLSRRADRSFIERVHSHIDRRSATECWPWTGSVTTLGRGCVRVGQRKTMVAARVIWLLENGEIAAGQFVCHTCDNPICVNPAHLFLGSHEANLRDCSQKGRTGKRRHVPIADRIATVKAWRASGKTGIAFAAEAGIHPVTLSKWSTRFQESV